MAFALSVPPLREAQCVLSENWALPKFTWGMQNDWDDGACQENRKRCFHPICSHLRINLEAWQLNTKLPTSLLVVSRSVCKKQFWCPKKWTNHTGGYSPEIIRGPAIYCFPLTIVTPWITVHSAKSWRTEERPSNKLPMPESPNVEQNHICDLPNVWSTNWQSVRKTKGQIC